MPQPGARASGGTGSAVSPDYDAKDNAFNGEVKWVQIDLGKPHECFAILIWQGRKAMINATTEFGRLIALGATMMIGRAALHKDIR